MSYLDKLYKLVIIMNSIKDHFTLLDELFSWDPFHKRIFVVNKSDEKNIHLDHVTLRRNEKVVELDNASLEDVLAAWKELNRKPTYQELEKELNSLKELLKTTKQEDPSNLTGTSDERPQVPNGNITYNKISYKDTITNK